ncbi:DUF4143 domain-containing protein [candidate division KSB1 bacterium]|nr:DUF4143 domain-containing protein [candidate division KSB1 bacterium]
MRMRSFCVLICRRENLRSFLAFDRPGCVFKMMKMPRARRGEVPYFLKSSDRSTTAILNELRHYLFVGGMPEGVREYYRRGSLRDVFTVQAELINTFRQDFAKYAGHSDKRCLDSVLHSLARGVGMQVKYARLAEDYSNPTLKKAFELLTLARIAHKVCSVNPVGLPLGAAVSPKKFKALLADIGLMQKLCGMPVDVEYAKTDLLAIFRGAMAEQFVGQEALTAGQELYYWSREAKSSSAEVDFLLSIDGKIVQVEVKSSAAGRLRSLHLLLNSCTACPEAYVFSGAPCAELPEQKLTFLPLYYAYSAATGSTSTSI